MQQWHGSGQVDAVDLGCSGRCALVFWKLVHFTPTLPTFCKAMFGWVAVFSLGIITCSTWLLGRRPSDNKQVQIPKQEKVEKQERSDETPQEIDLNYYKLLRKDVLKAILKHRKCRIGGNKGDLIHRLVEDYRAELDGLAYKSLQGRLKQKGLKATGKKGDLLVRLLEAGLEEENPNS